MRLRSTLLFGALASVVIAAPVACSSGSIHPPPGESDLEAGPLSSEAGDSGGNAVDAGDAADGADAAVPGVPASIAHVTTLCGTTACGIMGIRKSGFQELADVAFVVKDADGKPVAGVPVTFELESPPTGTDFLTGTKGAPTVVVTTDVMGIASARVESGLTLGVFTVKASVSATIQATSPAIGVRGVTPANRGFTLQCDLKNLAAYVDPAPPKPLKTTCTVTLVDRFSNPVGKGTTINLKVEAGAIASSVQSTPFAATGASPNEGKATVEFSTVGTWPAVDVTPLTGEAVNPAGGNQRDALVTVLAYVAGEEAFDDDNLNGKWDPGENFIDQGEPFVDANDNNQRDIGEFCADVAPPNGQCDPPNGVWDKQTTIWTTAYILYSGTMTRKLASEDPIDVPQGIVKQVTVSFADNLFNPPQSGSATSFQFSRLGNRGAVATTFDPILDGYGFTLTRALYDAANPTVGCSASVARCVWLTNFDFSNSPFTRGITATFTGAAIGTLNGPQADTLKFSATVHGTKNEFPVSATFQ
jgi:hypothetical protein